MRRVTLALFAALVVGATAAPASAAGPIRIKLEPSAQFIVTGACAFAFELVELRVHGNLLDFVDKAGEFRRTIIAGNFVIGVTNLQTEKSLTLNISGQFIMTPNPDNSLTLAAHGRNLFFTIEPEPFTGPAGACVQRAERPEHRHLPVPGGGF
jgi:hypothetical protein